MVTCDCRIARLYVTSRGTEIAYSLNTDLAVVCTDMAINLVYLPALRLWTKSYIATATFTYTNECHLRDERDRRKSTNHEQSIACVYILYTVPAATCQDASVTGVQSMFHCSEVSRSFLERHTQCVRIPVSVREITTTNNEDDGFFERLHH